MRRTIVSEPGEHNVSLAGGTMTSSSYRDVPWIGRGAPVHVEVEATWDDDLPPGRMQLRIEDTEGETVHAVAAGPRPVQVAFTAEPQASAMRIFLDVAPDGDGASVVLAERVTEVSVAQTTACP